MFKCQNVLVCPHLWTSHCNRGGESERVSSCASVGSKMICPKRAIINDMSRARNVKLLHTFFNDSLINTFCAIQVHETGQYLELSVWLKPFYRCEIQFKHGSNSCVNNEVTACHSVWERLRRKFLGPLDLSVRCFYLSERSPERSTIHSRANNISGERFVGWIEARMDVNFENQI